MKHSSPANLVDVFAKAVAAQTDAIWRGDPRTGNKEAKKYITAFRQLRQIGNDGRDALALLLTHERPDVRVMAAAYLLRHRTFEAMVVLRTAAAGQGLLSFEASECIKRWEEGTWTLDRDDG